jgi:hypothetical protein
MSKQISVASLKKNIKDKPEQIRLLLRTLPYSIKTEMETHNNPGVLKSLKSRLSMVEGLYWNSNCVETI